MSTLPFKVFLAADAGSVSIGIDDSAGGSIAVLMPIQKGAEHENHCKEDQSNDPR